MTVSRFLGESNRKGHSSRENSRYRGLEAPHSTRAERALQAVCWGMAGGEAGMKPLLAGGGEGTGSQRTSCALLTLADFQHEIICSDLHSWPVVLGGPTQEVPRPARRALLRFTWQGDVDSGGGGPQGWTWGTFGRQDLQGGREAEGGGAWLLGSAVPAEKRFWEEERK